MSAPASSVRFRTCDWADEIDIVELLDETAKSWLVNEISPSGSKHETRYMKGAKNQLHRTWDAAHAHLVKRAEMRVRLALDNVATEQALLERIKAMKRERLQ